MKYRFLLFSLMFLTLIGGGLGVNYSFEDSPTAKGQVLKTDSGSEWGVGQFNDLKDSVIEREVQKGSSGGFLLGVKNLGRSKTSYSLRVVGRDKVISNVELGQKSFSIEPDSSESFPVSVSYSIPSDYNGSDFDYGVKVSDGSGQSLLMRFDGEVKENSIRNGANSLTDNVRVSQVTVPFWVIPFLASTLVFLLLIATAGVKPEVVASSLFFSIIVFVFLTVLLLSI